MPRKKVLVVEDEKPMANALRLKLESSGFDTVTVFGGREAIKSINEQKFDVILLDLIMPEVDGFKVLETLREQRVQTPVIVLSNLGQPEDIERAKKFGARDYCVKSNTTLLEIVQKVRALLKA